MQDDEFELRGGDRLERLSYCLADFRLRYVASDVLEHALVVRVSLSDAESARKTLTEQVVPAVSHSPGFIAGYWTWSDDQSNGQSMIVFESQEAAQTVEERIRGIAAEGATVESTEVRQVVASA